MTNAKADYPEMFNFIDLHVSSWQPLDWNPAAPLYCQAQGSLHYTAGIYYRAVQENTI